MMVSPAIRDRFACPALPRGPRFSSPRARAHYHLALPSPAPNARHAATPVDAAPLSFDDAQDLEVVASIRRGDRGAWTTLVQRFQDRLFAVCFRMTRDRDLAADLTQDAFVKLIQGLDKFDGKSKFSTWAIRVTMNVCLSRLRAEKLRRHASLDAPAPGTAGSGQGDGDDGATFAANLTGTPRTFGTVEREPGVASGVIRTEDRDRVLAALRLLEADQRAILLLRDAHGLEYDQIAETLGVAVGTIKSRLFRARAALRENVEKLGGD